MRQKFAIILSIAAIFVLPATSFAREPRNQNDPCSTAGRNTCGTNGVGFYKRYRYGIRWFGDFRGAVTGADPSFCIDLRWWYPASRFDYRLISNTGLKNSNGKIITAATQSRMSYALWNYGRSRNANQQAAVMLYIHSQMGDGAVGEVDPTALNSTVVSIFNRIKKNANRYRGPYRMQTSLSPNLTIGKTGTVRVKVISAAGYAVPGVTLSLSALGATGLPATIRTNSKGIGSATFTPTSVGSLRISARTARMAANLPRIYRATTSPARNNAQRMAAAASQTLASTAGASASPGQIAIATKATPNNQIVGDANSDEVTISGIPTGTTRALTVKAFGPFASQAAISCSGAAASTTTLNAHNGINHTATFAPSAPGWYQYQISFAGDTGLVGFTTACDEQSERFRVQAQPRVTTVVQSPTLRPGGQLRDIVRVSGLSGQSVTVSAKLYGPFTSRSAITCTGPLAWSGTLDYSADGEQLTAPATLTTPGYYTYHESIAGTELVKAVTTQCADVAETATVVGQPTVTTQISAQETRPGARITDSVVISGLGAVAADVQVQLWGPYDSKAAISCSGTPYSTETFTATGDGTYRTQPVTLTKAGYYTYRESLAGSQLNDPAATNCAEDAETTIAIPRPTVYTRTQDAILPGGKLSDRVVVGGLGQTPATVELKLYGPFSSRTGVSCSGSPVWTGRVQVPGDGTYTSASVTLPKVGFYVYQERLLASGLVPEVLNSCGRALETALVRPLILTGFGDPTPTEKNARTTSSAPTRVQIPSLNIDGPVSGAGIDMTTGALAVPSNVRRLGWWRDGAAPADPHGTTLIAGHVDSAVQGNGVFKRLVASRVGTRIKVTTGDGRVRTYRVTSVRRILKAALPAGIFTQRGKRRLVLVTCGGPFDAAIGHYRDNIVVVAVPV